MSLLGSFVRKKKAGEQLDLPPCPHFELAPRWDSAAAMGNDELITHYQCCACGEIVSREEARAAAS